ncbi:MAG: sigma-54 dependent transcriptional regulator [Deltaproteobacteria bacterium]|jgi:two-component system response regulator HydG|nr:sigma-54 dependent transcriptional regulator [Deltaproteobacteria bacterium]
MNDDPILIVDDDPEHLFMLKTVLGDWGHVPETAKNGREAVKLGALKKYSLILMDVRMGDMDGLTALAKIKAEGANVKTPVIIMTAYSRVSDAVMALKTGAMDYLTKPLDLDVVRHTVNRALERKKTREEKPLELQAGRLGGFLVGESPAFRKVMELVELVAPTEATVLITGESGVGKEMVARLVQSQSSRKNAPFITINCAAIPENLLEAELFGHEKGAFTGAERRREGRLKAGEGGTVFLDEIAETSPALQAKLLRALQEGEIQPVGSDSVEKVDTRFIAATNRDLVKEVEAGRFREDLYWRLNVVAIYVPALRERPQDLAPLANFFIQEYARKNRKDVKGLTAGATAAIMNYCWPGNIRELQNAMERAVILTRGDRVSEKDMPLNLAPSFQPTVDIPLNLEELEKLAVEKALNRAEGNKTLAAAKLGVTRKTLAAKLKKFGLDDKDL